MKAEGGFPGVVQKLGLDRETFLDKAVTLFQKHKDKFPNPKLLREQPIYILGTRADFPGIRIPLDMSVSCY